MLIISSLGHYKKAENPPNSMESSPNRKSIGKDLSPLKKLLAKPETASAEYEFTSHATATTQVSLTPSDFMH
jgi:hypothetical protein